MKFLVRGTVVAVPLAVLLLASAMLLAPARVAAKEDPSPDRAESRLEILSGEPRLLLVHGYSTSRHWWAMLQRKIDRYLGQQDDRAVEVQLVIRGGTPIAKWIDVETGQPREPWVLRLRPVLQAEAGKTERPVVVLAQQSLQWVFSPSRSTGIRGEEDGERIRHGADAIEKYARLLLDDGADAVFIAMHIYKAGMEPEIGNERLALAAFLERGVENVFPGPDVWEPTSKQHPHAFAADRRHPNLIGAEMMAQLWFEALLKHDGREIPEWSREEMQAAIAGQSDVSGDKPWPELLSAWGIDEREHVRRGAVQRQQRDRRRAPREAQTRAARRNADAEATRQQRRQNQRREESRLPEGVRSLRDLSYVDGGHERQKLDLFLPETADGPLPVVVWVHGGAWRGGNKESCPIVPLVERGFAVASINYRLSQHAMFPAQIEDCKAALRWLRAHATEYRLDPERFGVIGSSAGGHLVALLGTTGDVQELEGDLGNADRSSRVQAVVDWFGPTDFLKINAQSGEEGRLNHDAPNSPESQLIGGPVQENPEKAQRANPIRYISADDPPFLIMHGDRDFTVPLGQSTLLHEALTEAGVPSTLVIVGGAGHGRFQNAWYRQMVEGFFDQHLK